ncbi:site-specific recombinase [Uliginosibacterium gangwonense]|uniref:site-specific recombinase n=1 Tax=Uliginosibacterium gangwonense TaxID=392736 RepID=UPI00037466D0|nr:hypothetical protein [Uliginosibacterium gangwonense]
MSKQRLDSLRELQALADHLRPNHPEAIADAARYIRAEAARLRANRAEAARLAHALDSSLALPRQTAFYAETGVRSALGFWLELNQRLSHRILPPADTNEELGQLLETIFHDPDDHLWVNAVDDEVWAELFLAIGLGQRGPGGNANTLGNLLDAARVVSYRLAGAALDQELLHADPALEEHESPFLAQNAQAIPMLDRAREGGAYPSLDEIRDVEVLLDQCAKAVDRVRRRARENGISIRLTYQLARMRQLIGRLRELLDLLAPDDRLLRAIRLMKTLLTAVQTRHRVLPFIGENIALLARNVTDCASRHGEHYIAADRQAWWGMLRSAAGGGVIIAIMALLKIRISLLHLPPLTEAIAFSLNYGLGFVLIHMLGLTVATKQPAMTAASIAATVEEAHPRELDRLCALVQSVTRTQFIAVIGNVLLAVPIACLLAFLWYYLTGVPLAPSEKAMHLLADVHPWQSGALLYAAVAGLGLFLSGLVSGFFDNKARYHSLALRIRHAPLLRRLSATRATRIGHYVDEHLGAILGNLFFGFYLGMTGALSVLTGLPVDIRHVAFSSANLGTALTTQGWAATHTLLPWAIAGVIGVALVNLLVSFSLALYVAMKSRQLGAEHMLSLGQIVLRRFLRHPLSFVLPPPPAKVEALPPPA